MTFHSVFINLRKKCVLGCCTITNSELPDSLLDSRVFLALKGVGSSPVAFKNFFFIFFRFASFFVFILDCVLNWIHLSEFGMRLCNKYSTLNNFNKPTCDFTLCTLNNF